MAGGTFATRPSSRGTENSGATTAGGRSAATVAGAALRPSSAAFTGGSPQRNTATERKTHGIQAQAIVRGVSGWACM